MNKKTKKIVYSALFAALVFVATYTFKVPAVVTHGYIHLGDGFIFIAIILLGIKYGSLAGAIGASLSDLLGGYTSYILPTFIIKLIMGLIMGYIINKTSNDKKGWLIGSIVGSIWQIAAYYVVGSILVGSFVSTLIDIPGNILQSSVGIVIALLLSGQLKKFLKI